MDPLEAYRRTQRILRREFDTLTKELCPTCLEPCCRIPTKVTPLDVAIAEACGWRPSAETGVEDAMSAAAAHAYAAIAGTQEGQPSAPCPFLTDKGCDFPGDVRPYGCAMHVCRFINGRMSSKDRARFRRYLSQLRRDYERILQTFADNRRRKGLYGDGSVPSRGG